MAGLLFFLLIILPALDILILIGPVLLVFWCFPRVPLLVATGIFMGLICDHLHNFDGLSYEDVSPHGVLGLTQAYLPFSLIVAIGGVCLAARAVLLRL